MIRGRPNVWVVEHNRTIWAIIRNHGAWGRGRYVVHRRAVDGTDPSHRIGAAMTRRGAQLLIIRDTARAAASTAGTHPPAAGHARMGQSSPGPRAR